MLRTDALDYHLPEDRIATEPAEPRDSARMLVVSRSDPERLEDLRVRDLPSLLREHDVLVRNATRVVPARFTGVREDSGGRAQGLYLSEVRPALGERQDEEAGRGVPLLWNVLIKARRQGPGVVFRLNDRESRLSDVRLELLHRDGAEDEGGTGGWVARVHAARGATTADLLERLGLTPLPPYILQARKRSGVESLDDFDRERYQTVFADRGDAASVAAPTAGLHFTPELIENILGAGARFADVLLHVGAGTFKPVETEFVEQHPMHSEWCDLPARASSALLEARKRGGRIIAIGTTSARTLESFERPDPEQDQVRQTRLLITPGYGFRNMDALLTNFHLPRSTLLALVAAFLSPGADAARSVARLLDIYRHAIGQGYRFYSYGDAMLILP